ncbi:unnamed protein product [Clonostachys rosea f. rosea IK726]|uniref:Uncharacterized protein n=1 Tax=Clonostachys rosea f. rosea IK726 TaxID=1349383 RepID=A0ACA9UJR0_BIOOC|nr:unnamed protein product [Clonostachys rosea f. rosea IK726]
MSIFHLNKPAIPFGSLVVISGVSGFIGSHVADQTLAAGYRVRGTTTNLHKNAWAEKHFKEKYGTDSFELAYVPDMAAEAAFDDVVIGMAVQFLSQIQLFIQFIGAAGFIHVANDMTGSTDPKIAIPKAVDGAINALKASAKEPNMKRFIYTSSSFAAGLPRPNEKFIVNADTFYEEAVKGAWEPNPHRHTVYSASKIAAERAISEWVDDNKPSLVVNFGTLPSDTVTNDLLTWHLVLPNANIGPVISPSNQGYPTSAGWVKALWDGDSLKNAPPQHYINVQDDAKLHVIALTHPAVQHERIFAVAGPVSLNDIISILRKIYPERQWKNLPDEGKDLSIFEPIRRAEDLLLEAYRTGFVSLEESVKGNAADLVS